ncbi:SPW repeat protein [Nocardia sp. NBC_00511]|uniref:SPW repeat protein n=1 Tax=Nocardia sp. NBC_00511 TaxID=2903591 RepID=UPI0030E12FCD
MANYMHQATSQRSSATDDLDGERHGGTPARMVDGLVVLAGLFTAISPWVVRGYADAPRVVIQNLVLGVAVAILGLALTLVRDRRHDPSWVLVPIGVWVLLAPWIVDQHPGSVSWTNVLTGIVIAALGAAATALLMSKGSGHQRERVVPEIR